MWPEPIYFRNVLWKRVERLKFLPTFLHMHSALFERKFREAVRHMSSSVSFKHIATKVKKNGWYGFIIFDFQTKTDVWIILYACLYSNSMICVHKPKKAWEHSLFVSFHKFVVVSYSHADSVAVR